MSCLRVRSELCAYHFGVVSEATRREVETHLLGCRACLLEFLEVKRAVETGADTPPPPLPVRDRLRAAVARELGIRDPSRPWAWWERPVAFAFAASVLLAATVATRIVTSGPAAPPYALSAGADGAGSGAQPR